ncbi:MAG: NUDIX hydrolase [Nannocystaceae bacterium]|nr:NUDIX hydrolase [Myxococcales bacterium]
MHDADSDAQETTILASGKFLRLLRRGRWEYAERVNASGAAAIVAVTGDGKLLLVEQPREPLGCSVIELPAGLVGDDPGQEDEGMGVAAGRELEEETGYRPAKVEFLTRGPSSPGMSSERLALFRATGLTKVGPGGGVEHEQITVHEVALADVEGWLRARAAEGAEIDVKVWAGLYFATAGAQ